MACLIVMSLPLATVSNYIRPSLDNPVFMAVLVLGMILGMVSFFSPRTGLLIMLPAALFGSEIQLGGGGGDARAAAVRIEDILLITVSLGWLANRAKTRTLLIMNRSPVNGPILWMSIAMIAATCMGLIQDTAPIGRSVLYTLKRLEYFWMFYMTLHIINDYKGCRQAIQLMYFATAAVALYGIIMVIIIPGSESPMFSGGLSATTGDGRSNIFGSFLLLVIAMSVGRICYADNHVQLLRNGAIFVVLLITLIATKSRASYVCVVPLILAMYALTRSRRILDLIIASAAIMLLGILALAMTSGRIGEFADLRAAEVQGQFESIGKVFREGPRADSSLADRFDMWETSWAKTKRYPIFGNGIGAAPLGTVDNQYVRELQETGVVGLFCFLVLIAAIMKSSYELFIVTQDRFVKSFAAGFLVGMIALLIHALTIANFYTILVMEIVCVMLAILMALHQLTFYPNPETDYGIDAEPIRGAPETLR